MDRVKMAPFGFIIFFLDFFIFFLSHTPGSSRRSSYLGKSYWTDEFQKCTPIYNLGWWKNLIPWGIHFVTATWISNFYLLPYTTFTFIYYLYSFRHNYLEISLSFTTLIHFTTCHEQFSLSFTTWIRSDFSQCFPSVSPLFHHCFKSVSKVFQKCF